jgi:hypothetical protein
LGGYLEAWTLGRMGETLRGTGEVENLRGGQRRLSLIGLGAGGIGVRKE